MPSKGITVYAWIAIPDCQIEWSVPKQRVQHNALNAWSIANLEVDTANIPGHFKVVGRFSWKVVRAGQELASGWVDVNALTGNIGDGTMKTLASTPSIIGDDFVVAYGFYDAGPGKAGLPNRHQCYVTVAPNNQNWMADAAPEGSPQAEKPFNRFILPATHDVGMNSMQNVDVLLQNAPSNVIVQHLVLPLGMGQFLGTMSEHVVSALAPNIVYSLSITQKDTLNDLLTIGARYFEFRPAHVHSQMLPVCGLPDELYFQHACIPGMVYREFLHDIVNFLVAHPLEICVVQIRFDGILHDCAFATDEELAAVLDEALQMAVGGIQCGTLEEMQTLSINDLRGQGKRLILFKNADSLSTYTDEANATLNGDSIVAEFEKLSPDRQAGKSFTNIQCQATATNIRDVVIYSVLAADASTSCLIATKPTCDSKTLPWIQQHTLEHLQAEQLVVVMNDFLDGATAEVAIGLSRQRLA